MVAFKKFPKEILHHIGQHLSLRMLLNWSQVSQYLKCSIRDIGWSHCVAKIKNIVHIESVIENYKFTRLDFSNSLVCDEHIDKLKNLYLKRNVKLLEMGLIYCKYITQRAFEDLSECDTVSLSGDFYKILNIDLIKFKNCNKITLQNCFGVTINGLRHLENCTELGLFSTHTYEYGYDLNITGKEIASLANLHTIAINGFHTVVDEDLRHLSKLKKINLSNCPKITDCGVQFLTECQDLNLTSCENITGKYIYQLQKLHTIVFDNCIQFVDQNVNLFEKLPNLTDLSLVCCTNITDKNMSSLKNLYKLNLSECFRITDNGLMHFSNIHTLIILRCYNITNKGLSDLEKCHKVVINNPKLTLRKQNIEFLSDSKANILNIDK